MIDAPEFSHIVRLSEIGSKPQTGKLSADQEQRRALALRFDIPKISSIAATYKLVAGERGIAFTGMLTSDLHQSCAITGEAIPVKIRDKFDILFIQKPDPSELEEEIELTEDECDIVEYEQAQIDLGEAIAQTLYLSLDPYPRGPDADNVAKKKGLKSEAEAGPFGALAALKDKLG
jgi:uncharacterized metal-binding protein YceD (DUF177 family)